MKKAFALLFILVVAVSSSLNAKKLGVEFWGTAGDADSTFMKFTQELGNLGFVVSDPHPKINMGYAQMFGQTTLDNLGFFSIANDEKLRSLLEKYPALGGFSPFNLHIYKLKTENTTWVGHLRPEVMADIVGLKDEKIRAEFLSMFPNLDRNVIKNMGSTQVKNVYFDTLPETPMMTFKIKFNREEANEDFETFVEEFQEKFEATFEEKQYLIAGYKNFKENYTMAEQDFKFDAYFVYSLCHFPFSNAIFNEFPEAGVFAPCSVYFYIDKDSNEINIGMPKLANWVKIMGINNPEKIKMINELDADIISIFKTELEAELVE